MATTITSTSLSLSGARIVLDGCVSKASSIGPFNISVCDAHTNEIAFYRMDGAKITSVDVAKGKAFTSAGHKAPTRNFASYAGVSGPAYGLHTTNNGKFSIIPGGLPITNEEGTVIGSVGVSGGTPDQDEEVAMAGVEALKKVVRSRL